jgi:flagellar hook assembly protein FlgD
VTIRIYDNGNRLVKDLIHNIEYPGVQEIGVEWDGRNGQDDLVANGVYFAVIENSQGERAVCKIAVLR